MQTAEQLKTLDTLGLLEILWELFAKKSAVILSFRHSFTLSRQRGKGKTLLVIEIFFTFSIQRKTWSSFLCSLAEWAQNSNFITTTGSWLDLEGGKYAPLDFKYPNKIFHISTCVAYLNITNSKLNKDSNNSDNIPLYVHIYEFFVIIRTEVD